MNDDSNIIGPKLSYELFLRQYRMSKGNIREIFKDMSLSEYLRNKNKASLITFMRDMYVPIHDGYGSSRINHAYEAGGVGFLTECLNMNFGLHIDGVVKVNFWGFVKAVDILGGVDISLTENEVKMMKDDYIDISGNGKTPSFHSGSCHLDGNAALAYCRIRSLDNDYNRTARQRKMLTTLFNKVKSSGAGTLQNLANSVLSCCQTTMSNGTMAGYMAQILPKAGSLSLSSYRLPAANTFRDVVIGDCKARSFAKARLRAFRLRSSEKRNSLLVK